MGLVSSAAHHAAFSAAGLNQVASTSPMLFPAVIRAGPTRSSSASTTTDFRGLGLQDPLFLDGERRAVSSALPTATGDLEEKIKDFHRLLARLRGKLTLSYSCHDLVDNREKFPSPLLMAAYRIISGNHEGTYADVWRTMTGLSVVEKGLYFTHVGIYSTV